MTYKDRYAMLHPRLNFTIRKLKNFKTELTTSIFYFTNKFMFTFYNIWAYTEYTGKTQKTINQWESHNNFEKKIKLRQQ